MEPGEHKHSYQDEYYPQQWRSEKVHRLESNTRMRVALGAPARPASGDVNTMRRSRGAGVLQDVRKFLAGTRSSSVMPESWRKNEGRSRPISLLLALFRSFHRIFHQWWVVSVAWPPGYLRALVLFRGTALSGFKLCCPNCAKSPGWRALSASCQSRVSV
jgi:hypothetical protein